MGLEKHEKFNNGMRNGACALGAAKGTPEAEFLGIIIEALAKQESNQTKPNKHRKIRNHTARLGLKVFAGAG